MKKILFLVGLLMLRALTVSAQTQLRIADMKLDSTMYNTEFSLRPIMNGGYQFVTPMGDTLLVANIMFMSKDSLNSGLANLGGCNPEYNDTGLRIDSIRVGVITGPGHFVITLPSRGQHELINKVMALPTGERFVIREIYRRMYDCGVMIWAKLLPPLP